MTDTDRRHIASFTAQAYGFNARDAYIGSDGRIYCGSYYLGQLRGNRLTLDRAGHTTQEFEVDDLLLRIEDGEV